MKPLAGRLSGAALAVMCTAGAQAAVTIDPHYAGSYKLTVLGSGPGVPPNYGGLTIMLGDTGALLLGGTANSTDAKVYSVPLERDAGGHITGFDGTATVFANANGVTGGIDGGLAYGPGGVLFYTTYFDNYIGQIERGSSGPDKLVYLGPGVGGLGVARSVGGLAFVPADMPGAGRLKIVSSFANRWYDATVAPDGTGTYNITRNSAVNISLPGTPVPEGIVYVPLGSPLFPTPSVLIAEFRLDRVSSYEVNANGDPILSTRRTFISGLESAQGATLDPVTRDFLFSTFGGGDQILRVTVVPEPGTWVLLGLGLAVLGVVRRRFSAASAVAPSGARGASPPAPAGAARSGTSPA